DRCIPRRTRLTLVLTRRLRRDSRVAREEPPTRPERDVDEGDEHGHLDERSYDAGERLARGDAEDPDGNGDRELEVVAGGGEGQRRRPVVAQSDRPAERERHRPHQSEVRQQRYGDAGDVT